MSDFMGDISRYLAVGNTGAASVVRTSKDNSSMDMTDFLTLMVTQMTNQSIDDTADTSEMLNQMVQMQMITAITNLTDASIMTYAASLVGKEVTVGQYDAEGNLQQLVGVVSGTGTYGGEQVVFVDDKYYYMNEIMAVGRLPEVTVPEENKPVEDDKVEGTGETEAGGETDSEPDQVEGADGTESGGEDSGDDNAGL